MKQWKCSVCGYVHTGETPPDKCPVCGADKSLFQLLEPSDNGAADKDLSKAAPSGVTQWRCTVCGYVHTGATPPDKCPVCGADNSLFVPVLTADQAPAIDQAPGATPGGEQPQGSAGNPTARFLRRLLQEPRAADLAQRLTQLHGHPVAVHIPNGLLPVSVLFTVLAILFGSEGFATAARYNTCFVALSMPIVIATGLVDWVNRFGGRMTPVFKNKMICAGAVTVLSILLCLWWIIAPNIYNQSIFSNMLFLLFNVANLGAAGLAGWYGGKLVFHK